jgi:peptidoglycan hydrolase-like protein with peptidoglycan-binding domain
MFKKIFLVLSVCVLFVASAWAQDEPSKSEKADKSTSSSASESSSKPAAFRPTKDQIRKGQEVLIAKKLWNGEATGIYGESRPAIKEYQKQNGLDQNGKFDKATLTKMGIALTDKQKGVESHSDSKASMTKDSSSSSDGPKRPAPFQATKEQITALQEKLKGAKMFTGAADGERSDELKDAVRKYQDANGLKSTGGINAATLEKAGIALTDKQKANVAAQKAYDAGKKD